MDALFCYLSATWASSSVPMLVLWTENKKEICLGRHQSLFLPPWPSTWQKQPERGEIYLTQGFRRLSTPWQRGQWEVTLSQHTEIIEKIQEGTRARHNPQEHTQPTIYFLCLTPPSPHPRNVIILGIYQRMNQRKRSKPSWSNCLQKQHHRHPQNCFTNPGSFSIHSRWQLRLIIMRSDSTVLGQLASIWNYRESGRHGTK